MMASRNRPEDKVRCPVAGNALCSDLTVGRWSGTVGAPRIGDYMKALSKPFSRRALLAGTSSMGVLYAATRLAPLPALADPLADDPRIAKQPIADKGFASIRKIGDGLYATIADRSKGLQARCNGGFLVGREAAIMVEGFQTTTGAAFQLEALRTVTQLPILAAINTHWHFDHTLGNSVYCGAGIPIWAHAHEAPRIPARYPKWQAENLATILPPLERPGSQ